MRGLIGEGSRKRVFRAHDVRLDRAVAVAFIKTEGLDQVALDRVHREAREMGRLGDHPNVVTVYDIGEADGLLYIVTQYMAGGDVKRLLGKSEAHRLTIVRALELTEQVCSALEHAHARGVVHRDVKPDNVWLTESGVAHLGDFGLALGRERTRLTSEGTIVGTFAYMAPEQALGRAPEARSDLYSVGAMLYEMVTGRPPFVGDDPVVVVSQHINAAPVAPSWHNSEVPADLEALILKLLSKTPDDRPADASAVRLALAAISRTPRGQSRTGDRGSNPLARLAGGLFVGRLDEMEALRTDVVATLAGQGRLVLVGGEPGIGKTSIAQEAATYARLGGAQVLWGRCDDTGGAPPYWPWVQMIRSYVHDSTATDLTAVMGSGAGDIAQVVPEVARSVPQSTSRPPIESDETRFRLFDSIATFLRNAGRQQPIVLVIDDLHAADKPSLLMLQFLARQLGEMHIMVVAAYRDVEVGRQHPLFQVLGELVREPVTRRITLRGLIESDVYRYIELSTGTAPPAALLSAVFSETEGNPFFVGEVVRLLASEGRLDTTQASGIWRSAIPQGVREVIGRRLDRLSPECNRVLALASVAGREFSLNVLERAGDVTRDRLLDALEEAVGARVIAEAPPVAGRYTFSHGLFRETLYGELTTTRRVQLHRRVGEAIEAIHRLHPESHFAELAHHFFEAAQGGDAEKALHYLLRAGDRATTQMAHEEAARHFQMALQVLDATDPDNDSRLVDVLLMLSEALWRAGEVQEAKSASVRAIEIARNLGAAEQFARAVLGLAGRLPAFGAIDRDETVITLLREALTVLEQKDSAVRARVMARLAEEQTLLEHHEERWALSRQAVEMARRIGDPAVLGAVLKCTFFAHWDPTDLDARLTSTHEMVRLADQIGDRTLGLEGRIFHFLNLVERGDVPAAQHQLDACERTAKDLRQPYHQFLVALLRGCMAYMTGRLDDVQPLAQEAMEIGERAGTLNGALFGGVQLGRLMWLQGQFMAVEPVLMGFGAMYPFLSATVAGALAATYSEQNRHDDARAQLDAVGTRFDTIPRHFSWQAAIAFHADATAALRDVERARELYEVIRPLDGRNLLLPPSLTLGPAAYYLGILATVMEQWDTAIAHFENAIAMDARTGARQHEARTRLAYAETLLQRGNTDDKKKAVALATEVIGLASPLGMLWLVERAQEIGGSAPRVDVAPEPAVETPITAKSQPEPGGSPTVLFRREGEYWTLAEGENVLRLKDMKGLRYLAHLVRHPGAEFHALELVAAAVEASGGRRTSSDEDEQALDLTGLGPVLDETAKTQYRNQLSALQDQLVEADALNDPHRSAALRTEIESLKEQLAGALGLGGRERNPGSSAERARTTVTKGIKNVVAKIRDANPPLGRYLANHVRTGNVCVYMPDPDRPILWSF